MAADPDSLLRVHAGALNGHDLDSLAGHYLPRTRLVRDGRPVGEGADALRALEEEYRGDVVGRVMEVDGHPALVAWSGPEGRGRATNVVRLRSHGGRIVEVRIDHDAELIQRLVDSAPRQ
ncbi:MAG TPA: hypothetical protein VHI93_01070 [Candidatus Thermoplasmatota archaeon]|nr:hypothetical protein [Candidatus Thermoplasmatota archaeon]